MTSILAPENVNGYIIMGLYASLLDKIKAFIYMKIEDCKLNWINNALDQAEQWSLTLKFIEDIYCEYKADGSRVRVSRVSTTTYNNIAEWKRSSYLEQAHSPLLVSLFRSLPLDDILLSLLTRRSWLPLLELCSSWSNSIGTTIGRARVSNRAGIFLSCLILSVVVVVVAHNYCANCW